MKQKNIRRLVMISVITFFTLVVTQFLWVKKSIQIQEEKTSILKQQIASENREFDNKVVLSLIKVRDRLVSLNKEASQIYLEPVKQITDDYYVVSFYDTIDQELLKSMLIEEFTQHDIIENFEYGVYDCFYDSIIFDKYVAISNEHVNIDSTSRDVPLLKWDHDGYYFGVYFPNHKDIKVPEYNRNYIFLFISSLMIFIVLSFLAYTLNVILQQKKLSEIKTDFINNMTHELKTPISTISLSADVLLKDLTLKENERLQRYLNIIKTENTRLQSQVERVLQLAKLEQGKIQLNFEKLDLHELIRKCAETFQVPIQNNDGELKLNLEASNSYINGDLVHVTNMIYNLLDNANKYSNEDPYIEINTSIEGEYILVSISDKGKGLKKEDLKYIFEKFYRVNTGNIHDVKGFGLGLYYVHEMIRVHNGKIEVESKEGEGSVFKLFFPLIK